MQHEQTVHAGHVDAAHAGSAHAGHGDRVPHDEMSAAAYAARLEPADRDAWQQPVELLAAIGLAPGARVADVGTGSGYFLPHLSRAVGPSGHVVGEDIRDDLLDVVRERSAREHLANVEARLGTADDPRLEPGLYDLVLFVDTYHHIANRPVFLAHLARALAPRGRLVIVDFREGPLPVGPPPEHKIALAEVEREVRAAGFAIARTHTFLRYQWVLELVLRSAANETSACVARPGAACAPRGERPRIVLDESLTPTEAGLPALSADGVEVALAVSDPESASSSLLVRYVSAGSGSVLRDQVVLSVEEALALEDDTPSAALRTRVEQRVGDIDAALARGGFTPIASMSFSAPPAGPNTAATRVVARGQDRTLSFGPTTSLLMLQSPNGHEHLHSVLPSGTSRCTGREVIHAPSPTAAWLDLARSVLVVRIRFADVGPCRGPQPRDLVYFLGA